MFENFTRILGISLELQAFAIIGDIKKLLYMDQIQARSEDFKRGGGGEIPNFIVSNATRPEWPRLRRDRVQGRGTMGNFPGGHKQGPKGRSIRA